MQPSILVIRGGAIGDFILTLPVLAALRRGFPGARLEVLGYEHIACLAKAGGLADAVHSLGARPLASFFARNAELPPDWAAFFQRFEIIISYLFDPDGIFQENVTRCTQGQFIAGPYRPNETGPLHASEALLQPLQALAIWQADPSPRLNVSALSRLPEGRRPLALHPGSGSDKKNWPEARWAELLQRLGDHTEIDLLLVGGEAEADRLERLSARVSPARIGLARNLPLPELAATLGGCRGFIGHDSGITHLAAALGVPVVVLWGPTNETVWRPHSDCVTVVKVPGGLAGITVDQVWQAIQDCWRGGPLLK